MLFHVGTGFLSHSHINPHEVTKINGIKFHGEPTLMTLCMHQRGSCSSRFGGLEFTTRDADEATPYKPSIPNTAHSTQLIPHATRTDRKKEESTWTADARSVVGL